MIKNWLLPTDKYEGFNYYARLLTAGALCSGLSFLMTYPLDLVHTRMVADMSSLKQTRHYPSSFKTFNYTNVDETRNGLYKGMQAAGVYAAFNGLLFPIYDVVKRQK